MTGRKSILKRAQRELEKSTRPHRSGPEHSRDDDLELLLANTGELSGKRALDVATGGGHTAIALARAGARVTAIDVTYEMLDAASGFAAEQGVSIEFEQHAAEELPYGRDRFDLLTCCVAVHRFADPKRFISEAARVLVPGGRLLIIDTIAPGDPVLAAAINEIEKASDPSHVEAYPVFQWITWLADSGFDPELLVRRRKTRRFEALVEAACLPETEAIAFERDLLDFPPEVKEYLGVVESGGHLESIDHESALFVSILRTK